MLHNPIYEDTRRLGILEMGGVKWVRKCYIRDPISGFEVEIPCELVVDSVVVEMKVVPRGEGRVLKAERKYELTDHLNNVRVVIIDQRVPVPDSNNQNIVAYYKPLVKSIHDYYPFGWEKQLTTVNPYPFNYQGQLFDTELGWEYYRYRNYDPMIARFYQVEPLVDEYPMWSGYIFSGNMVVFSIEMEGLEPEEIIQNGRLTKPMVGLISGFTGMSEELVESTVWLYYKNNPVGSLIFDKSFINIGAITLDNVIFYGDAMKNTVDLEGEAWWDNVVLTIFHELEHVRQYENEGELSFLLNYVVEWGVNYMQFGGDYDKAYRNISYEKLGKLAANDANRYLKKYRVQIKDVLSSSEMSDDEKYKRLKAIGLRARIDKLNTELKDIRSRVKMLEKELSKSTDPYIARGINMQLNFLKAVERAWQEMINSAKSELANFEQEQ